MNEGNPPCWLCDGRGILVRDDEDYREVTQAYNVSPTMTAVRVRNVPAKYMCPACRGCGVDRKAKR